MSFELTKKVVFACYARHEGLFISTCFLPRDITCIFLTLQSVNFHFVSFKLLLSYPRFKSKATLGDRSFTCAAARLWNALPFDIRSASTVSIFNAKLRTHLFRHAFLS